MKEAADEGVRRGAPPWRGPRPCRRPRRQYRRWDALRGVGPLTRAGRPLEPPGPPRGLRSRAPPSKREERAIATASGGSSPHVLPELWRHPADSPAQRNFLKGERSARTSAFSGDSAFNLPLGVREFAMVCRPQRHLADEASLPRRHVLRGSPTSCAWRRASRRPLWTCPSPTCGPTPSAW